MKVIICFGIPFQRCLEVLKNITKDRSQDNRSHGRDLNIGPLYTAMFYILLRTASSKNTDSSLSTH